MKIIGLCGGSGSGKGEVAKIFSAHNIVSIDTDKIYRDLTSSNTVCMSELVSFFGSEIQKSDGSLDRRLLADIVFNSDDSVAKRQMLNKISHAHVLAEVRRRIKEYDALGFPAVAVDAPLLFESEFDKECDTVVGVIAEREERIKRIMSRDKITRLGAESRIASQLSDEYISEHSDYIIINNGDRISLQNEVGKVAKKILER